MYSVITIKRRGLMFIISAPSGTGKTTLAKKVIENDQYIDLSTSCTTRQIRPGEVDGVHYYFKTEDQFKELVKKGYLLEYANIFGAYYGTLKEQVLDKLNRGKDVLFDIDWQGHRQLTSIARPDVTSVFLLPPSKEELFHRLTIRNQDNEQVIAERMARSDEEISHWYEYDYIIINRNIKQSLEKLLSILRAERLKKERRIGLDDFINNLVYKKLTKTKIV